MSNLEEIQTSVLLTTFTSKSKRYKVYFHQNQIIWDREKPPYAQVTVSMENIIAVRHIFKNPRHPLDDAVLDPNSFIIHYAKRATDCTWKYANVIFSHSDPIQVSSWVKTLQNYLETYTHRPKNLLIFVNPYGGKKKAMKIYEKIAKPLFLIAGIDVTLNVSQRKDQIRDFVTYHNLDMYDAVGCVGGDGTLSELFNGLVMRECQKQGLNYNDVNLDLPKPTIPVGVIPGGSTDTIAYCLHGTTDIPTSVLHIILGERLGLDLVSVYNEERLLRLYASVLSYGYLGDIAHHSDKYRWLGPKRYEYSGFRKLLKNKGYEGEIAMQLEDSINPIIKCMENCPQCIQNKEEVKEATLKWKSLKGKFFMVSGANISCACERSRNGISPYSHLGDGNVHLILVRHTSLLNNLRLLLRLSNEKKDICSLPFVEIYKARQFCFRSINSKSFWNCDGEVQTQTDIRAKVCCQLLTMFGKGVPESEETTKKCFVC